MTKYYLILFFVLFGRQLTVAEIPRVLNFTKRQYDAHNQNWSISEGTGGRLFFGNSAGLLMFDGARWQTFLTPGQPIIRAVHCGRDGRIFVGGFATIGYWEPDQLGQLKYHSLLDETGSGRARQEETWHILPTSRGLFFQSFSRIYRFDEERMEIIYPPGNIMFLREVNGRILAPVIDQGLYEYTREGAFEFLPGSELLADKSVAAILPLTGETFLVGTEDHGIFKYENGRLTPWRTPVSERLRSYQLNKGLRLSNGNLVFGTILNGLYFTDERGEILYTINQENGLQNNTVLALYESDDGNLWVGMDKGIDLVVLNSSLSFFSDKNGEIGMVYTAALQQGRLYVGTNRGVFFKSWPGREGQPFQLVEGAQGHAWSLQVMDGQLLCAHNSGTLRIEGKRARTLYATTGAYGFVSVSGREDWMLQDTYTGLIALRKGRNGEWAYAHDVEGFGLPISEVVFEGTDRLWVAHPRRGVYHLRLGEGLDTVETLDTPTAEGLPPLSEMKANLNQWDGKAYILTDSLALYFDVAAGEVRTVTPDVMAGPLPLTSHWVSTAGGALFRLLPDRTEFYQGDHWATLQVSLAPAYEAPLALNDSLFFLCLEEGYCILNTHKLAHGNSHPRKEKAPPLISEIVVLERGLSIHVPEAVVQPLTLGARENGIRFFLSDPDFPHALEARYRLSGFQEEWTPLGRMQSKEFTNLPPGRYRFEVRAASSGKVASFAFVIDPYWYQTWWARLIFLAVVLLGFRGLWLWHESRLARQKRAMEIRKERELQQQRIRTRNERLQGEVHSKSRELANSTMGLVRKNEVLINLRKELKQLRKSPEEEASRQYIDKLIREINYHLSSEEDWKVFEENFNHLHDQFLKRLADEYPELTPGDLRLAAFLKMNLSSKEIAPLLNISLRGVENKRYRLRRKLQLTSDTNLTEFLMRY